EVNRLVLEGMPFRDAYKKVGKSIADGTYKHPENIHHTHEGSMGNLCTEEIRKKMENILESFHFEIIDKAYQCLLQETSM
nr:argininosuccinate lyase [Bacteroidales bacterium]